MATTDASSAAYALQKTLAPLLGPTRAVRRLLRDDALETQAARGCANGDRLGDLPTRLLGPERVGKDDAPKPDQVGSAVAHDGPRRLRSLDAPGRDDGHRRDRLFDGSRERRHEAFM